MNGSFLAHIKFINRACLPVTSLLTSYTKPTLCSTGTKMSTQCTDSGITGAVPGGIPGGVSGGILNRAQVPNVTVTPGYNQPPG